jgi:hypothetical protein
MGLHMNWTELIVSLSGLFSYMLLWHAGAAWLDQRVHRAFSFVISGLVLIAMTIPVASRLPDQSFSVQLGAAGGLILANVIGAALHARMRRIRRDAR